MDIPTVLRKLKIIGIVNLIMNRYWWIVKKYNSLRSINQIDALYSKKYFYRETNMTLPSANDVVEILIKEFNPKNVVDIGCGTGVYLKIFAERGIDVLGLEGSSSAIENALVKDKIRQCDLTKALTADKKYQLVICFEVGEHLDPKSSDIFVKNIVKFGDTIAFSAAHPGQGGRDHINEQPSEYWIKKFNKQNFSYQSSATARLRAELKKRHCVWWLPMNLLVFKASFSNQERTEPF